MHCKDRLCRGGENVRISDKFVFLVDYAHNEMSLRNLLGTLRGFDPGRLVVIFGCGATAQN